MIIERVKNQLLLVTTYDKRYLHILDVRAIDLQQALELLLHTNEGIYYNRPLETDVISLRNQMYGDWGIRSEDKITVLLLHTNEGIYTYKMWRLQNYYRLLRLVHIYENSYQVFFAFLSVFFR